MTAQPPKPKAYSYIRFSTPEQAKGDSMRRQTAAAERYAAKHGLLLDFDLSFRDLGKSAYRGGNLQRGGLGEFLRAVEDGLVEPGSYLLLESLDRFSRENIGEAYHNFYGLLRRDIVMVTLSDERVHSREAYAGPNEMIEIMATIMQFGRAYEESRIKGERVHAAWNAKRVRAAEGKHRLTKRGPSWLKADGENGWRILTKKAEIVQRLFEMTLEGYGKEAIAAKFNEEGIEPLGRGTRWHPTTIQKTLRNPAVVGTLVPHLTTFEAGRRIRVPETPIGGYYPPIIDLDVWDRVQGRLGARAARGVGATSPEIKSVFAGLGRCSRCGATVTRVMKGAGKKGGRPKLVCAAAKAKARCDYVTIDYEQVEQALFSSGEWLCASAPRGGGAFEDEKSLEDALAYELSLIDRVEYVLDEIEAGNASDALRSRLAALGEDRKRIAQNIAALEARIVERSSPLVDRRIERLSVALSAASGDAKPDRKLINGCLKEAVDAVTFDHEAGRMTFSWRHGETSDLIYRMQPV
jgi:DNA invertase Pin-like site-specific DNA recombinase